MPLQHMGVFIRARPRLQAQEDLRHYKAMGLAFGSFGKKGGPMLKELNRQAGYSKRRIRVGAEEGKAILAVMKINTDMGN